MNIGKKKILFITGGSSVALVLAVVVFAFTFDLNSYKPRIEAAASAATGLEVTIKGDVGFSFFPFGASAGDISVSGKAGEIVSIKNLKLGLELMPLLKKELKLTSCELVNPIINIVKDAAGRYNFNVSEKKQAEKKEAQPFALNEFRVSGGSLTYLDRKTGEKWEFSDFDLAGKDLVISNKTADILKNIYFAGGLDCRDFRKKNLSITNIKSVLKVEKGVIYLNPLTMDIFGAKGEGDALADKSGEAAVYKINLKVSNLDISKFEESIGSKKVLGGKGDVHTSLIIKEKGSRSMISGLDGTFSFRGDNLVIYTMDLDKVLSSYETSQKFNLVDLGAFFIAGPLSTVALKGYRYGDVYAQSRTGQGTIRQFVSNWKISSGVADATDCALATNHNRVALKGRLNFVTEQYDDVIVALLDDSGCAKYKQGISGSFGGPQIGPINTVETLAGPLSDLFRKAKGFVLGGKCQVFYTGSVKPPR